MKNIIKKIPVVNSIVSFFYYRFFIKFKKFDSSEDYWKKRYERGGNSGAGSYKKLAEFKAEVLNEFVEKNQISSVIEFGCGDGNQLKYLGYPSYIGFDISEDAVKLCKNQFNGDKSKNFKLLTEYSSEKADLVVSLDVIYHLIEDQVFDSHMKSLFSAAKKYVIIYSSNTNEQYKSQAPHVKHRKFTDWTEMLNEWKLINTIKNKYPYDIDETKGSFADFYMFEKVSE